MGHHAGKGRGWVGLGGEAQIGQERAVPCGCISYRILISSLEGRACLITPIATCLLGGLSCLSACDSITIHGSCASGSKPRPGPKIARNLLKGAKLRHSSCKSITRILCLVNDGLCHQPPTSRHQGSRFKYFCLSPTSSFSRLEQASLAVLLISRKPRPSLPSFLRWAKVELLFQLSLSPDLHAETTSVLSELCAFLRLAPTPQKGAITGHAHASFRYEMNHCSRRG